MVHSYGITCNRNIVTVIFHINHPDLGQYSKSFQGPNIWNSIDNKTKDTKSIFSFKKCIKQKLLSQQGNDNSGK